MSSTLLADTSSRPASEREPTDLLVLWQHPVSREIVPVGRFGRRGDDYCFSYTAAAAAIAGFRPLPGLPDLRALHRSDQLPLIFGQRVVSRSRRDHDAYVGRLGLDPASATPWEQIVCSGGRREGDTLQFMEVPRVLDGRARAMFFANGVRHIPREPLTYGGVTRRVTVAERDAALAGLTQDDRVSVLLETGNAQDADSCLILAGPTPVGWVPRALSSSVSELINAVGDVFLDVVRVGDPRGSAHLRLVLRLDAPVPDDFEFDRSGRWVPLADF